MADDKGTKVVLAQTVVANPSASVTRAEQIAAAHEKVSYEAPTLMGEQRARCMTGEEALSIIDYVSIDKFRQTFRLVPVDICI